MEWWVWCTHFQRYMIKWCTVIYELRNESSMLRSKWGDLVMKITRLHLVWYTIFFERYIRQWRIYHDHPDISLHSMLSLIKNQNSFMITIHRENFNSCAPSYCCHSTHERLFDREFVCLSCIKLSFTFIKIRHHTIRFIFFSSSIYSISKCWWWSWTRRRWGGGGGWWWWSAWWKGWSCRCWPRRSFDRTSKRMVGVLEWWHGVALAAGDGARRLAVVVAVEWGARVVGVEVLAVVVVLGCGRCCWWRWKWVKLQV